MKIRLTVEPIIVILLWSRCEILLHFYPGAQISPKGTPREGQYNHMLLTNIAAIVAKVITSLCQNGWEETLLLVTDCFSFAGLLEDMAGQW